MRSLRWMPILVFGVSLAATSVTAGGSADEGRRLAEEWCSQCHDISADGPFKLYPPSFAAVAVYRSPDQISSRISFPRRHYGMPRIGLILDIEAVDDLVAYITSLERPVGTAKGPD